MAIFRNHVVDLLRGTAIIAVLILHFHLSYHLEQSSLNKIFSIDFIKTLAGNGNYGVTMFFVISGFLITSTTLERYDKLGGIDLLGFYIFRFSRIMPCLILMLMIVVIFNFSPLAIFKNDPATTSLLLGVISVLTFWHNLLMANVGYFNYCLNILWSLSVEEMFYIAFPLLCLFINNVRVLMVFFITLIVFAPFYRNHYAHNEIVALYGYFSCFDAIAMGCCAAIIARKIKINFIIATILYCCAWITVVAVYAYAGIAENIVIGVSLLALSTAIMLICAKNINTDNANLLSRLVCWFGRNSYEIYLFHIIVLALMKEMIIPEDLTDITKIVWLAVFLSLSAIVAGSISRLYSQPLNKWLRKALHVFRQRITKKMAMLSTDNYFIQ